VDTTSSAGRSYRLLSAEDRVEIVVGLRLSKSVRAIARDLNRNPSVISREIRHNSTEDGVYHASWAHNRSARRRRSARQRARIPDEQLRGYLREKLSLGWSPEQIAGRAWRDMPRKTLSHETIYQYIFKCEPALTRYLVYGHKHRRRKQRSPHAKRIMIAHRTPIEQRPEAVNTRQEYGHWEADTAVSRQSSAALMVLQERMLGITFLQKLPRCAPAEVSEALIERLKNLPPPSRRSITFDNGQENRHHAKLHDSLAAATYFCTPYSSWQKGSVENAIGLTRRVWPKKTDYATLDEQDIAALEYRLNTRPRKRFGYLTPIEYAALMTSSP
jgi:IS30 family transposase